MIRFTWRNPETGRRERGVFKVLKPHIPEYFTEDMDYLQGLADYFGDRPSHATDLRRTLSARYFSESTTAAAARGELPRASKRR